MQVSTGGACIGIQVYMCVQVSSGGVSTGGVCTGVQVSLQV